MKVKTLIENLQKLDAHEQEKEAVVSFIGDENAARAGRKFKAKISAMLILRWARLRFSLRLD